MGNPLINSLSLIDTSGIAIITTIMGLLCTGVVLTLFIRARYASMQRELMRHGDSPAAFEHPVLQKVVRAALTASRAGTGEVNTQAIVEQTFQAELRSFLVGERFVRSMT